MSSFKMLPCFATAVMLFAASAFADDPALTQDGSGCPAVNPAAWCGSGGTATDSATGITTVEYIFSAALIPNVAADWSGWVEGTIGGTEAELLHFVPIGSGPSTQYGVFLYCGGYKEPAGSSNPGAGICSAKDDVPSYENSNVKAGDTYNMFTKVSNNPLNGIDTYAPDSSSGPPPSGTNPALGTMVYTLRITVY